MSTNSLNWKKLDFVDHGDNYSICLEYPYDVRNDTTGKIRKLSMTNHGYYRLPLCDKGKTKYYLHHVLVWISHYGKYDQSIYDIDHRDKNRSNNHIDNLRLVNKSLNSINTIGRKHKRYEYHDDLPDKTVINEEHKIYYCKQYDKFFRFVVNEYRELSEHKQNYHNGTFIQWQTKYKQYYFTTTNFRENL